MYIYITFIDRNNNYERQKTDGKHFIWESSIQTVCMFVTTQVEISYV